MRNIFQATTVTEAALVRNLLAAHGIEAKVVESVSHHPVTANSEVWVENDSEGDRAVALVRELYAKKTGENDAWTCPACNESNPGSFDLCWSCGTNRTSR